MAGSQDDAGAGLAARGFVGLIALAVTLTLTVLVWLTKLIIRAER